MKITKGSSVVVNSGEIPLKLPWMICERFLRRIDEAISRMSYQVFINTAEEIFGEIAR